MYKITLELTEEEAEAMWVAIDGLHQECLMALDVDEDPPFDYPDDAASLLDKLIEQCRAAGVTGFHPL